MQTQESKLSFFIKKSNELTCWSIQRRDELLQEMMASKSSKSKDIKEIMTQIGLKTPLDYEEEISKLRSKQAGTVVVKQWRPGTATIFSLSIIDDYKVTIGSRPKAIPSLVGLLKDGTTARKRDAATAFFNLAVYGVNEVIVVLSGAVPLLIDFLMDDKAGITDDALAVCY
ncbi:U-box domain-containing protein 1-like protein [Tanacetum coccineum]